VAEARWLAERGVDAIIAQGFEAGGHRGMFLTENVFAQVGTPLPRTGRNWPIRARSRSNG
jgi:NAD(P)H-dependent flavin oxidoreductase YrpB (nitropropane dioxygenase family)